MTGTVDDGGTVTNRQEIAWRIEFNTNKLVLETPKLVDTFSPTDLDIVADTFKITTGGTTLGEGTDYEFTRTANGFEVQFIGKSEPAVYVVEYRTTIPVGNDVSSINTAQLEWQGNVENDTANVDLGKNTPGSNKNGATVAYEENGETLKKNEWNIRFNTNKRIIQNFVLTDTYTPGEIVDEVVITRVGGEALVLGTDYAIIHTDGKFVVTFEEQTEPVEYSLTYSTSYNLVEDREDAVNSYEISFLGGTEKGSKTIAKPTLNLQKASTNVKGILVDEKGKVTPAVISWEVKGNTGGPNYVYLKNAVFEDVIQNDQRYVAGSMKLNGVQVAEDAITWTGSVEENDLTFTVKLPDGAAEHVLTFDTEIYSYPSNATRKNQSEYQNRVHLVNFKGNVDGTEERQSYSAYAQYFKESSKQDPTKTGIQNSETDLIEWEAIVNADELPIKNAEIRDFVDEHQVYVGLPEVYAMIHGTEFLVPESGYKYEPTTVDNKPAFKITFNGPTSVTPNEEENGIHYAYKVKYKTSLLEAIVGTRTVSNIIQIVAYNTDTVIETIQNTTYSEKWYFGGSGSSRSLTMKFNKVDKDNNDVLLEGVTFELNRVTGSDNKETNVSDFTTLANGSKELETQRAGRYILYEKTTLPNYVLGDPVYFIIGYDADGDTVIDKTDSNFANPTRIDGDVLSIENEKQKIDVTSTKIWEGDNPVTTIHFDLYRNIEGGEKELVDGAHKELLPGTTEVSWNGIDAVDPSGNAYIYSVMEVDVDGNDYTPIGFTKVEDGMTVTNTAAPIEIMVEKAWNDNDNQDGIRPEGIEVRLIADNVSYGDPFTLNDDNDWSKIIENLPAYNDQDKLIVYSVIELDLPEGYESNVTMNEDGKLVLTNTHIPAVTELTVNKVWEDGTNQDGLRPESIKVQLMVGEDAIGVPVVLDATSGWTHKWSNLSVNAAGEPIEYSVVEVEVPEGYDATVSENVDGVITITNTHTPAVVNIPVSKEWNDEDNQDGLRSESITANLLADGTQIDAIELSEDNEWKHIFEGLPVYNNGESITYTITENAVEHYSTEIVEGVITNNYTPEETSVTVTKNWQDGNNQDGNRLESIEVQLIADGVNTDHTAVLTEENNWTATWSGLALNSDGTAIDYSVEEITEVDGYEVVVDDTDHGNIILTNSYEPVVTDLTVNKVWDDAENQDGIQPELVKIQLIANTQEQGEPVTLNAYNNWTYSWTDLAVNAAEEAIAYSIVEVNVPEGYTSTASEIVDGTITVTNEYTPEVTNVSMTKEWNDEDNLAGFRPDHIEVELYVDGVETGKIINIVADEEGAWKGSFINLPKYRDEGTQIDYTVKEVSLDEDLYSVEVIPNEEDVYDFTLINTHEVERIELNGTKTWNDTENQDGVRPESITVRLLANGVEVADIEVTEATDWTFKFTGLPKFENGEEINYTIQEDKVGEYSTEIDGMGITNSYTPGKTSVNVVKAWDDVQDQDGIRPESITVKLFADGKDTGQELVLSDETNWQDDFTELDEYSNGKLIVYIIEEVSVEGYEPSISGTSTDGFVITNSYTPELINLDGVKTWNDTENQDGVRPESITVRLLANGKEVSDIEVTAEAEWTFKFTDLPKFENGEEINYTIQEDKVGEYSTEIDGMGITNSYTPGQTSINVVKAWDDVQDQDGIRPESITVKLFADGNDTGQELVLSDETNWQGDFTDLDVYAAGEEITYTIEEVAVEGYDSTITGTSTDGFIITNTYKPEDPEEPEKPEDPEKPVDPTDPVDPEKPGDTGIEDPTDSDDGSDLPSTGEAVSYTLLALVLVGLGFGLRYYGKRRTD